MTGLPSGTYVRAMLALIAAALVSIALTPWLPRSAAGAARRTEVVAVRIEDVSPSLFRRLPVEVEGAVKVEGPVRVACR